MATYDVERSQLSGSVWNGNGGMGYGGHGNKRDGCLLRDLLAPISDHDVDFPWDVGSDEVYILALMPHAIDLFHAVNRSITCVYAILQHQHP